MLLKNDNIEMIETALEGTEMLVRKQPHDLKDIAIELTRNLLNVGTMQIAQQKRINTFRLKVTRQCGLNRFIFNRLYDNLFSIVTFHFSC